MKHETGGAELALGGGRGGQRGGGRGRVQEWGEAGGAGSRGRCGIGEAAVGEGHVARGRAAGAIFGACRTHIMRDWQAAWLSSLYLKGCRRYIWRAVIAFLGACRTWGYPLSACRASFFASAGSALGRTDT